MPRSAITSKLRPLEVSNREAERHAFLKDHAKTWVALPSDASKRQYFRYDQGLLMDAPHPENPEQFMHVANYLISLGFSAPKILRHDLTKGFLILEDFGDATFTQLLAKGEDRHSLYNLAVDTLIALHKRAQSRPDFIASYEVAPLLAEAELLVDWYIPSKIGKSLSSQDRQTYLHLWEAAFQKALNVPHSLTLRDYHVDNLMRLEGRQGIEACGLLDFQDALWGPVVYDLVSLVEDARMDLDPALVDHCWKRYLDAFPQENGNDLRTSGCILSAGRHAKILGIFTRLAVRDGKPKYLTHIPRIQRLLQNCLSHPELHDLKSWFQLHV
jgi:hypothetical protein